MFKISLKYLIILSKLCYIDIISHPHFLIFINFSPFSYSTRPFGSAESSYTFCFRPIRITRPTVWRKQSLKKCRIRSIWRETSDWRENRSHYLTFFPKVYRSELLTLLQFIIQAIEKSSIESADLRFFRFLSSANSSSSVIEIWYKKAVITKRLI